MEASSTSGGVLQGAPRTGIWKDGAVQLSCPETFPEGTRFSVVPLLPIPERPTGHFVIIAGYGLSGRYIGELLKQSGIDFCIIDKNPSTVRTQQRLGHAAVEGDVAAEVTLRAAGIDRATILALSIPDEEAVARAAETARRLKPDIYILARCSFASRGLKAVQRGADDIITAEEEVALRFHERLTLLLTQTPSPAAASS